MTAPWVKSIKLHKPIKSVTVSYFGPPALTVSTAKEMEDAAYKRGYEQASNLYNSQILETRNDVAHLQSNVFENINKKYADMLKEIQDRIPNILMSITRRILPQATITPESIKAIINEFFEEMTSKEGHFTISLSEKDFELVEKIEPSFKKKYNITFESDHNLKQGDCMMRSRFGIIDGRIETKIRRVESELVAHEHD